MADQLASVRAEWLRRVEVEYQSAAIAHHFTLWLIQIGASPDLIQAGLQIVEDELLHSSLSHQVYREAGGSEAPRIDRDSLGLPRSAPSLEEDLLVVGVRFFCLGETVAVPLFQNMRKTCTVPVARAALDQIVVDEVSHRDFGWTFLEWMLDSPSGEDYLQMVSHQLPTMLNELSASYGSLPDDDALSEIERDWGLSSGQSYARILERTIERDYGPRFQRLGIELISPN